FLTRSIPVVPSGGLNFVDARDAAEAAILAMQKGRAGERYLVGGPNWTFEEFFGRLERLSKVDAPRLRLPARLQRVGAQIMEQAASQKPMRRASTWRSATGTSMRRARAASWAGSRAIRRRPCSTPSSICGAASWISRTHSAATTPEPGGSWGFAEHVGGYSCF